MIDNLAILAICAFGWGLSLCTYRIFARQNGWPMGSLHADLPAVPAVVGLFALFVALTFAAAHGASEGGWVIVVFGLLLALFWTGFLRVGSQVSLVLAPLAAILLLLGWLNEPFSRIRTGSVGMEGAIVMQGAVDSLESAVLIEHD